MTNLEAFKQAFGGGSLFTFDSMYERYLNKIGMSSINDLKDVSDWLDLMHTIGAFRHRHYNKVVNLYDLAKRAYLIKYTRGDFQ